MPQAPRAMTPATTVLDLHGLTSRRLESVVRERQVLGRVARQIHRQVMCEGRFEPEALGLGARAAASFCHCLLRRRRPPVGAGQQRAGRLLTARIDKARTKRVRASTLRLMAGATLG